MPTRLEVMYGTRKRPATGEMRTNNRPPACLCAVASLSALLSGYVVVARALVSMEVYRVWALLCIHGFGRVFPIDKDWSIVSLRYT